MRIGIQGDRGSACDSAAAALLKESLANSTFDYLINADRVLSALSTGKIDLGVLALESPLGVPVPETAEALKLHPPITEVSELQSEVRHCILARDPASEIRQVASHPIPLQKHAKFLADRFPGYQPIPVADTGAAAAELATGKLSSNTAVIALPIAAEIFGLWIIESSVPANDQYLTRFVLVKRAVQ